ncbi:MAG: HlyD family efflux transporter periplasmic adaptor subunit [Oscillospiraceae bacterium]|nr:HlyD family efflux transporter periplasmic adaptor subunit [Oscillospiraceae bacterium]
MDKASKKLFQKYLRWAALALLVAFLAAMPLLAKQEAEADGPVASILSGTVEPGSVTSSLRGGGTLKTGDARDVTLPASVKITEFLVKNGQEVSEGTPVAVVDPVSVMNAIVEVTDTMEILQKQMESARNETVSSQVTATAGGRVKEVYAQAGDSVQDVMLEHGALAVLSLDGLMAVELTQDATIRTGDSLQVTLPDGSAVSGRVESNLDGVIIVTVEDEGYKAGDLVRVSTEDGQSLGEGTLYIHSSWRAAAFTGTVASVNAKVDATVSAGSNLFTLGDTDFAAQMEYLAGLHREYEELLQELCRMYDSGVITAPCDGTVSGIDKDSTHLLSAEKADWEAQLLKADGSADWRVLLLSSTEPVCTGDQTCPLPADSQLHQELCVQACDKSLSCDARSHHAGCIHACDHADKAEDCDATGSHFDDCIRSCTAAEEEKTCPSKKHYSNCIESCTISDGSEPCPGTGAHHSDCIGSCDKTEECPGTKHHQEACVTHCTGEEGCDALNHKEGCPLYGIAYTAMAAKVSAVGKELVVILDPVTQYRAEPSGNGWTLTDGELRTDLMLYETTLQPSNQITCAAGDIILILTGTDAEGNVVVSNRVVLYRKGQQEEKPGPGGLGGLMGGFGNLSGLMGMFGGFSGGYGGAVPASGPELFSLDGDVLMTVTPHSTVTLTIAIDQQDISKVRVGQAAQVEVGALKGQVFAAEVKALGASGTNSGGSSKFTVDLELEMSEQMLDGMSATATIPLDTKMDVLTIPVKALTEDGARTVVYTALDKETGEPAMPVEVQVGISDGEYAEILSGLSSGDTYYYSYYDTLELDHKAEAGGFSFGG